MKYKYIVLDFGNVLVTPTSGDWFITPRFLKLIDINKIDKDVLKQSIKDNNHFLAEKLLTMEEEYDMFIRFYTQVLKDVKYKCSKKIIEEIAYDRTYNNEKYTVCDNIFEELTRLKKKYKLLVLSDNWPCGIPYMKDTGLYDYFDKVYISSYYGVVKKDKVFFDYPIKDFNIKKGEALFIDDNEENLDAAIEKGFDCLLMDRYNKNIKSKYKVINDLMDI